MWDTVVIVAAGITSVVAIALVVYDIYFKYPRVKKGVVVLKIRQNERNWVSYKAIMAARGSFIAPYVYHDDDDWILVLTNEKGREGKLFVSEAAYNNTKIGDVYTKKPEDKFVDRIEYRAASIEDFQSMTKTAPEEQDPLERSSE